MRLIPNANSSVHSSVVTSFRKSLWTSPCRLGAFPLCGHGTWYSFQQKHIFHCCHLFTWELYALKCRHVGGLGLCHFLVSQCLAHSKHATNHPSLAEGCSTVIQLCFLVKTLFRTNMQLLFISIMSQRQWQISWRRGTLWITYSVLSSTCTAFPVFFCIFSPKRLPSKLVRLTLRFTRFLSVQIPNNHRKLD